MASERCQGTFERVNLEGSNTGAAMFIRGVASGESRDGYCINIYVNNNIQGVNNSILVGSEVKMRDPGIRLYFGDIKFPESNKSSNLGSCWTFMSASQNSESISRLCAFFMIDRVSASRS
ncbi:hypothetical protein LWI29_009250 [Acer saccharum]|uniref:Uncharacterized protein n=1 Tax=Acer saccharum TaxID=4024 RepID=A0AA39RWS6_ACESA|nr:hypothetical protein LWI29_009250 [Acer saccharum]